jgi:2-polyprenyl-3-methyl-5-hydroxy-6-metoxy-1,4-benzoquinol methylase
MPVVNPLIDSKEYEKLAARESRHWGGVEPDPHNPQIWHDPGLFRIFFETEYRHMVESAVRFGPRILELGCGEGNLAIELASLGMQVTAIDLSEQRIERARSKASRLATQPTFIVADLNTAIFPQGPFDCVVAHDSLHHILYLDRVCSEVKNSLRPGGRFLVIDYIGMGFVRKLAVGLLYALLPTYQPYTEKWKLRKRFAAFLATESQKREALRDGASAPLHQESPFEEISQGSIIREIESRFDISERQTFCPFWFYLAAKIRMPVRMKYPAARFFKSFDDLLLRLRLANGAYIWISAIKTETI